MAKAFSRALCNVERFKGKLDHLTRVVTFSKDQDPAFFDPHKVEDKTVSNDLDTRMPVFESLVMSRVEA